MTVVLEGVSAKPTWRYLDDAPPVRLPSRKRRLGAVLTYMAATAGVGAAIFWPSGDQTLAISEFKIPNRSFTALPAPGATPHPNPSSVPEASRLAAAVNRPLHALPKQSRQYSRPASSAVQTTTVAVVTPDTPGAQAQVKTPVPESPTMQPPPTGSTDSVPTESQTTPKPTAANQTRNPHRPQSRDTNRAGDLNHRLDSDPSNSETTKPATNSTPESNSTPTPDSPPKTASESAPASPPTVTENQG